MNMPKFTAEATLYNSATLYRSNRVIRAEIGFNVTPQFPTELVKCNVRCFQRFQNNPARLDRCLHNCDPGLPFD